MAGTGYYRPGSVAPPSGGQVITSGLRRDNWDRLPLPSRSVVAEQRTRGQFISGTNDPESFWSRTV